MKLEEKLGKLVFNFDKDPHIIVDADKCQKCDHQPCLAGCPAECFKLEAGKLVFNYEDCIECGTCKIICENDAIKWNYPRGSFGVTYRYG